MYTVVYIKMPGQPDRLYCIGLDFVLEIITE
jgi:hypothetical protein